MINIERLTPQIVRISGSQRSSPITVICGLPSATDPRVRIEIMDDDLRRIAAATVAKKRASLWVNQELSKHFGDVVDWVPKVLLRDWS